MAKKITKTAVEKVFKACKNLTELKSAYLKFALEYHPDHGGETSVFQMIGNLYEKFMEVLKNAWNKNADDEAETARNEGRQARVRHTYEMPKDFVNVVTELLKMEGVEIELCGRWLWISGNTKPFSARLKELGCKWSPKKKMWSWHGKEEASLGFGMYNMRQIRNIYGSSRIVKKDSSRKSKADKPKELEEETKMIGEAV